MKNTNLNQVGIVGGLLGGGMALRRSPVGATTIVLLAGVALVGCNKSPEVAAVSQGSNTEKPFLERRAEFTTNLRSPGPSPQAYDYDRPPEGVEEVVYQSGDLKLKAWLCVPDQEMATPHPAIVYFHGGFAFGASDLYDCMPFLESGYVVMTPWLRGENGQPGNFEAYWGELDDAVAATRWLSKQPYVDIENMYAFGHSAGGVLSAMLSLRDDVPVKHTGSSGGLYDTTLFDYASDGSVPFDGSNPVERQLRVLPGNLKWMKRPHFAFIGREDILVVHGHETAKPEIEAGLGQLKPEIINGGHGSSLPEAMVRYIEVIENQ